ncbi:MAG: cupin domain-containing protein [Deltaproteobacteria bacterium]|nr:cupin domain-containing protein [Deltaproteobacteria bacterium]
MLNVKKEEIDSVKGLHVIRLTFGPKATLKPHRAPDHVVVVCTRGSGRWMMNGEVHPLVTGVTLSVPARVEHAVEADDDLQVVITHVELGGVERPATTATSAAAS